MRTSDFKLQTSDFKLRTSRFGTALLLALVPIWLLAPAAAAPQTSRPPAAARAAAASSFHVEEATIADLHRAIQQGETTCKAVVQAYLDRARAYNGTCTQLVTRDGAPVTPGPGAVRAGVATTFPTATTPIASVLPHADEYRGLPTDFGRMESTRSDPSVQQQYGMLVGIPDAGQVNALSTLNVRGERSVTCKAQCDAAPSSGPLPAMCPQTCD